ncbi:MAG: RNA polymerase sigma factor RpoD/SigA [Treponema sp.]|nr:RNA polymerase sigma factor RpoD/SigA [Treponema sp.]MBD5436344.1 RNA polymerase sigma factor RpoD/SigA [Treponema sp.]MBD5439655.1 RNA polymerase sigma factor RpoD/SigA [Treponema sp.]
MKTDESVLAMYLKEINKIPLLNHDEENILAVRAKAGDKAAREKIVNANLRFVVNVAKKYQNLGLDFEDLVGEGNVGLLTAIDKFDASKGYHFISYAVWWIRQSILKAIYENRSAIRLPLNRVAELTKIQAAKKMVDSEKSEGQKIVAIADSLGMEKEHVRELLNISREMISLDTTVRADKNEVSTVGDFMVDDRYENPEDTSVNNSMKGEIDTVLDTLRPNEARVLRMRYGLSGYMPMSLKEVGDVCRLTKERIRQIEKHAIERMRMPVRRNRLDVYMAA